MNTFSTLAPRPRPRFGAEHSAPSRRGRGAIAAALVALAVACTWSAPSAAAEDGELLARRIGAAIVGWHGGTAAVDPVHLRLLGVNDLHGQLETRIRAGSSAGSRRMGGAAVLVSYLNIEREADPAHTLTLLAGDSVGASQLVSGLLHDEPTLAVLNALAGRDCAPLARPATPAPVLTACHTIATVGNHEFDHGVAELERQLYGGRHADGVGVGRHWDGSRVPTVASNVLWRDGERAFLPAAAIVELDGVRVGIVGAVTAETPALVTAARVAELRFDAEAPRIDAAVRELRARGVRTIVLVIHEGLTAPLTPVPAPLRDGEARGRLAAILAMLEEPVDVVIAGHTHQPNNVLLPLRAGPPALVVQARSYGTAYSVIDLEVDRRSGAVVDKSARIQTTWADEGPGRAPDSATLRIVTAAAKATAAVRERAFGSAAAAIRRGEPTDPESALGNLVADAERAAAGTDFAVTNAAGIRNDLEAGPLTHGTLYDVLPFGNRLIRLTMTGAELLALLEQQFAGPRGTAPSFLRIAGLRYVYDLERPPGQRVLAADASDGRALERARNYSVVANDFIVGGGDHYAALAAGRDPTPLMTDLEALEAFVAGAGQPLSPSTDGRVRPFARR